MTESEVITAYVVAAWREFHNGIRDRGTAMIKIDLVSGNPIHIDQHRASTNGKQVVVFFRVSHKAIIG